MRFLQKRVHLEISKVLAGSAGLYCDRSATTALIQLANQPILTPPHQLGLGLWSAHAEGQLAFAGLAVYGYHHRPL